MASDIGTKTTDDGETASAVRKNRRRLSRRWRSLLSSSLTRFILLANLTGLAVLLLGVLVLGGVRQGLTEAHIESVRTQAQLIAHVIAEGATDPTPALDVVDAVAILRSLYVPPDVRVRLFDADGRVVDWGDSFLLNDEILVEDLTAPGRFEGLRETVGRWAARLPFSGRGRDGQHTLEEEVQLALAGRPAAGERTNAYGEGLVSVSIPVQRVQAVLGVVTVETLGVDAIVAAERRALTPFILVAVGVTIISSALLTIFIAGPIRQLALAADRVRVAGPRRAHIPDLSARRDEIGYLSVALSSMTKGLADRIDAIEAFAADVAHELKNPLTSVRSAVETLPSARDDEQRERLLGLIQHDVQRIDRLISDISNASRLDAELARARAAPLDLGVLISQMAELYGATRRDGEAEVTFDGSGVVGPVHVSAAEGPLGQVFRNLIDNAKTFSPEGGAVRVRLELRTQDDGATCAAVIVDDDGPGIPSDNLERVFERFYTERPKGAAFGSHSGLGLAIGKQIVIAHRGRIWAENRHGEDGVDGARFTVLLPVIAP